jgi:hypothetical protein
MAAPRLHFKDRQRFFSLTGDGFVITNVLIKITSANMNFHDQTSGVILTNISENEYRNKSLVPLAGIEPALLAELDFESSASTSSATGALGTSAKGRRREAGGI